MFAYRIATKADLERIWDRNIAENPDDIRWVAWKEKYIAYNQEKKAVTFVILYDETPIGEGTLLLHPSCSATHENTALADGKTVANVNALRIQKQFEGQGHISKIIALMETYARQHSIQILTIGVEAKETRNLAIYLHWGFDSFIEHTIEDDELILYFQKRL